MTDLLLICGRSERVVDGKTVVIRYAYMANKATIWDQKLIDWANARDKQLEGR